MGHNQTLIKPSTIEVFEQNLTSCEADQSQLGMFHFHYYYSKFRFLENTIHELEKLSQDGMKRFNLDE